MKMVFSSVVSQNGRSFPSNGRFTFQVFEQLMISFIGLYRALVK